jgi:hypothetical protein
MEDPEGAGRQRRRRERLDPGGAEQSDEFDAHADRNQLVLWGVLAAVILLALLAYAAWNEWAS